MHQIRKSWPIVALCVFYVYLAFHALSGNQGLVSWVEYESNIVRYQTQIKAVKEQRSALEARTNALRASQLDLDILDIKAREKAFLSRPQEMTIWLYTTP